MLIWQKFPMLLLLRASFKGQCYLNYQWFAQSV